MQITIREPGSALTHFVAMIMAMFASMPLLVNVSRTMNMVATTAICIFILSMILLYAASTLYHSVNLTGWKLKIFKKIDHMMIFVLIAGTYTPICLIALNGSTGYILLTVVWGIALAGIIFKLFWVTCPKWVSSVLYIGMGWACVSVFGRLWTALPRASFFWLLAGGIIYTIGGVIYALKLSIFNSKHKYFGSHEIFHVFVMAGSFCHYICMYLMI